MPDLCPKCNETSEVVTSYTQPRWAGRRIGLETLVCPKCGLLDVGNWWWEEMCYEDGGWYWKKSGLVSVE